MSIETEVATLTTATDALASNVETKKLVLDTAASNAKSSADAALGSLATAEGYVLETDRFIDETYTKVQSAASAVAYQDLAALAESKVNSAVSVFVYDTSRDSDGGAWRHRCGHTSWYNEPLNTATRGARREFPAVAVIVGEANFLTIFDGDDPSLPMWMVFNRGNNNWLRLGAGPNALAAKNGIICAGSSGLDLVAINFIKEFNGFYAAQFYTTTGDISQRNAGLGFTIIGGATIVDRTVNDVAMTVLPNAPIDSATGLPTPTIAVATNGGVSVIKDDGTVVDWQTVAMRGIVITDSELFVAYGLSGRFYVDPIPASDVAYGSVSAITARHYRTYSAAPQPSEDDLFYLDNGVEQQVANHAVLPRDELALAANASGLTKIAENRQLPSNGMVSYITSGYNTGWMHGDIKGAWLSGITAGTIGVNEASELVTNGTFDTDTSGWTGVSSTLSWNAGGYAELTGTGVVGEYPKAKQSLGVLTEGRTYSIYVGSQTRISGTGALRSWVTTSDITGSNQPPGLVYNSPSNITNGVFSFKAGSTAEHFLYVGAQDSSQVSTITFDNISVKQTGNLAINGTFDYDLSSWTVNNPGTGVGWIWDNGVAKISSTADGRNLAQVMLTVGKSYVVTFNKQGTGTLDLYYNGASAFKRVPEATVGDITFYLENVTNETITFFCGEEGVSVDNVSVRLAEEDRSVNGKSLQVYGQITKNPVATGADLVGVGLFGTTGYFTQPYNPDLDFGTGDFYVMTWVKRNGDSYATLFYRSDGGVSSNGLIYLTIYPYSGANVVFKIAAGAELVSAASLPESEWAQVVAVRRNGEAYIYINGVQDANTASIANTVDGSTNFPTSSIGVRNTDLAQSLSGYLALLRIGAGAPSAEQIKKIYEDEKVLFQDGAQATLYGSSSAVTALAHDPVTDLLHVGTSAGRSDFKGLRRINNTTTAVESTISASGGLIVED